MFILGLFSTATIVVVVVVFRCTDVFTVILVVDRFCFGLSSFPSVTPFSFVCLLLWFLFLCLCFCFQVKVFLLFRIFVVPKLPLISLLNRLFSKLLICFLFSFTTGCNCVLACHGWKWRRNCWVRRGRWNLINKPTAPKSKYKQPVVKKRFANQADGRTNIEWIQRQGYTSPTAYHLVPFEEFRCCCVISTFTRFLPEAMTACMAICFLII